MVSLSSRAQGDRHKCDVASALTVTWKGDMGGCALIVQLLSGGWLSHFCLYLILQGRSRPPRCLNGNESDDFGEQMSPDRELSCVSIVSSYLPALSQHPPLVQCPTLMVSMLLASSGEKEIIC